MDDATAVALLRALRRYNDDTTTTRQSFVDWLRVHNPQLAEAYIVNRMTLRLKGLINNQLYR